MDKIEEKTEITSTEIIEDTKQELTLLRNEVAELRKELVIKDRKLREIKFILSTDI